MRTKRGAKARGIAFELSLEELQAIWQQQRGRCAVSNLRFNYQGRWIAHPPVATVGRQNQLRWRLPHRTNVRLVCASVNIAMKQFGEGFMATLHEGLLAAKLEPLVETILGKHLGALGLTR